MIPAIMAVAANFFLVVAFALAALVSKALDGRGFMASLAVGFAVITGGGLSWFLLVAAFVIMGVAVTKYKYGYKAKLGAAQERGGVRSWPSVLANGGLASIFAVVYFFYPSSLFSAMFLGCISTSTADTVATEVGLLSRGNPKLITNPARSVPPGTSGGVSMLGFAGGVLASAAIGLLAVLLHIMDPPSVILAVCVAGGSIGTVVDSSLGAAVQRKGYCSVCMKPTESLNHCGKRTRKTGGLPFIENNIVNLLATLAGALVAGAIALL